MSRSLSENDCNEPRPFPGIDARDERSLRKQTRVTERELKIRPNLGAVQTEHLLRDFFHQRLTGSAKVLVDKQCRTLGLRPVLVLFQGLRQRRGEVDA